MNEGHSALLSLALIRTESVGRSDANVSLADIDSARRRCVFTTHTPVPAGHDKFSREMVQSVLGDDSLAMLDSIGCLVQGDLNMTYLALFFSRYVNGVSMRHGQVSRAMFPGYHVGSITNGVHAVTWTAPSMKQLFDRYIPEWRHDNRYLRHAVNIPLDEIQAAHKQAKKDLFEKIEHLTGVCLDPGIMTIGFARKATPYKRADLLFYDMARLAKIAEQAGPFQIIYGGKAHPRDVAGKEMIRRVHQAVNSLGQSPRVIYLEEYDMDIASYLWAGVDLWLNRPRKPQEASGTSGMKAALNGVPSLSVLDGWWVEGQVEGVTGWAVGESWQKESSVPLESASHFEKLEHLILPTYYNRPTAYADIMRSSISLKASYFNSQRMMSQYVENAYRLPGHAVMARRAGDGPTNGSNV